MDRVVESDLAARQASAQAPQWIADDATLARLCKQWATQSWIALDTEFQRIDTFYPRPGLIQVADAQACYLIDPLSIGDFSAFAELLVDPQVLKLLHACSEDLEVFDHLLGVVPQPLYDTQVAAAFLGQGLSVGYQRMVAEQLGVEVAKEETRSDWLQRPLTEAQQTYAALDVVYLPTLYQCQREALEDAGKLGWLLEECAAQAAAVGSQDPLGKDYYLRFSQGWKLRPQELAILQALCAWREQQARARNVPRNHLLRNPSILALTQRKPRGLRDLDGIDQMRGRTISKDGRTLLQLIQEAGAMPVEACPAPIAKPFSLHWTKQLKRLRALVRERGEALQIAPEILVRKSDLEALIRQAQQRSGSELLVLPEGLRGWRQAVIGEALLSMLEAPQKQESSS